MYPSSTFKTFIIIRPCTNPHALTHAGLNRLPANPYPYFPPARKKHFRPGITKLGIRNNRPGVADTVPARGECDEGTPHVGGLSMGFGLYFFLRVLWEPGIVYRKKMIRQMLKCT